MWKRSSFCAQGECAEWRRSSHCSTGECAELLEGEHVHLRNSQRPDVVVTFTREEWEAFAAGVKAGEFG